MSNSERTCVFTIKYFKSCKGNIHFESLHFIFIYKLLKPPHYFLCLYSNILHGFLMNFPRRWSLFPTLGHWHRRKLQFSLALSLHLSPLQHSKMAVGGDFTFELINGIGRFHTRLMASNENCWTTSSSLAVQVTWALKPVFLYLYLPRVHAKVITQISYFLESCTSYHIVREWKFLPRLCCYLTTY